MYADFLSRSLGKVSHIGGKRGMRLKFKYNTVIFNYILIILLENYRDNSMGGECPFILLNK